MTLIWQNAVDLSAAVAARRIAPSEIMAATLAQIAALNPELNAIVALRDEAALLAEARAADDAPRRGWLHGLPFAVKDLADAAGLPTTMGSPLLVRNVPARDEIMVARLRAAGAIIIGKTNVPEWGLGSHTFNPVYGATRNPWDRALSAGGSSGGAAAALAAGLVSVADGSDMMGSLRNPAGWCGVYGMRPSWGLVPSEPVGDTFLHQLSTLGPMARAPADLAALLATMAGPDPRQPHHAGTFAATELARELRGARVAWLGDWGGALPMDQGVLDLCQGALSVFADMGIAVEAVPPPMPLGDLWQAWIDLRSWAVAAGLGALNAAHPGALKPEARWEIARGEALTAMQVHKASVVRSRWFAQAAALLTHFDALILPTAQVWPFALDIRWPAEIAGRAMDTYHRWMEVVVPASLIGLPVVAVPAGFGAGGLPMGLQLIGRRGADLRLLQLADGWHRAAPWAQAHPPQA